MSSILSFMCRSGGQLQRKVKQPPNQPYVFRHLVYLFLKTEYLEYGFLSFVWVNNNRDF